MPLGEDLKNVLVGLDHYLEDLLDERKRHEFVEEIRHRVDKHHARLILEQVQELLLLPGVAKIGQ